MASGACTKAKRGRLRPFQISQPGGVSCGVVRWWPSLRLRDHGHGLEQPLHAKVVRGVQGSGGGDERHEEREHDEPAGRSSPSPALPPVVMIGGHTCSTSTAGAEVLDLPAAVGLQSR